MTAGRAELDLGFAEILEHLSRRCHTRRGHDEALSLQAAPTVPEAKRRQRAAAELRWLASEKDVRLNFAGLSDVRGPLTRADKGGVLADEELIEVARAAAAIARLRRTLANHRAEIPTLCDAGVSLVDARAVYEAIEESYADDGRLADSASPRLGELRRAERRLADDLERQVASLVEDHADHLQDSYFTQREGRFVIPVRASAKGRVAGIVHGTSQSSQTVFIEPSAVVDLGNRMRLAQCAVIDEENRIRGLLSSAVAVAVIDLLPALEACVALDVFSAAAELGNATGGSEPDICDAPGPLLLLAARHPMIVLAGKECVANEIAVDESSTLVVSGPNAGGKTVALKTAGLAVLMARAGLPILCGEGSTVPWFDSIFTDIGDAQSLADDLSTFSGHIAKLKWLARHANARTLVLIDEIAVGTEPEQGAALAQAVLEYVAKVGAAAIVTTHYDRLKLVAADHPRFANASVGFDLAAMRPTFELHLGVPGSSGAFAVAEQQGLDAAIVARARDLIGEERADLERLLAEVSSERLRLAEESAALEAGRAEVERERARAELAHAQAKATERRLREHEHDGAVAALRDARAELERTRESLRRTRSTQSMQNAEQTIQRVARAVQHAAPEKTVPSGVVPTAGELSRGTAVYVVSLSADGVITALSERGRVTVQVGALKTTVALADLRFRDKSSGAVKKPTGKNKGWSQTAQETTPGAPGSVRTGQATLDLRGQRVDEALEAVDQFIDRALLAETDEVWLVHGHGTGALRKAVRAHIKAHKMVSQCRPGERREGGDGVTVATLAG